MTEPDELDLARRRYPVGSQVTGTVSILPGLERIGVFVDLDLDKQGFVDVLNLPFSMDEWPPVGTDLRCEVIQHRPGQVRLWPLEPRFQVESPRRGLTADEWAARKARYPVGSVLRAEVSDVYVLDRQYSVRYDGGWASLEWSGEAPVVGTVREYEVVEQLETTWRTLVKPR